MRVLGIDTSLRSTGIAVVEIQGTRLKLIASATLKVKARALRTECLRCISEGVGQMLAETHADEVSIEGAFFFKNAKTALILGEARGAAMAACAQGTVPIFEYAPRRVKQAVTGHGNADKLQVRQMVMQMLAIREEPQEDAGDAMALAICHLQSRSGHAALGPEPI